MAEITTDEVKDFLSHLQGQEISIGELRRELNIMSGTKSFDIIRMIMWRLAEQKLVRVLRRGQYKIVTQVAPIPVFSIERERRPPFDLMFPRNSDTDMEMGFAEFVVLREGDLILISGMSNYGKTTLCLNICGENIDKRPVLMGNEYSTIVDGQYTITPRILNRLDAMDWVEWVDQDGKDKLTLLPVRDDYAEHIVKDKINIIDWINIDTGEHYMIGTILEGIKKQLGRGLAIIAIQKAEGAAAGRGGQFTKDFADLELLIDKFGDSDVLLTIGKTKEYTEHVIGKTYAYGISKGVKIINFREVEKCPDCKGQGYKLGKPCEKCLSRKFIDK